MRGNKFFHNHLPSNKTLPECLANHIAFSAFLIIIKIPPIFPFTPSIIPYKSAFYQVIHSFPFSPLIFFCPRPFIVSKTPPPRSAWPRYQVPPSPACSSSPGLRQVGFDIMLLHPPLLPFSSWVIFFAAALFVIFVSNIHHPVCAATVSRPFFPSASSSPLLLHFIPTEPATMRAWKIIWLSSTVTGTAEKPGGTSSDSTWW